MIKSENIKVAFLEVLKFVLELLFRTICDWHFKKTPFLKQTSRKISLKYDELRLAILELTFLTEFGEIVGHQKVSDLKNRIPF